MKETLKLSNQEEKKVFVGKVFVLLGDSITCADIWGYYLFNAKTEPEKHLKILAGIIWFCSLYDSIDARDRELDGYIDIAKENQLLNTIKWCKEVKSLFNLISELLSAFSKDEQIYIQSVRDTLVHGWLYARNCDELWVKYVKEGKYIKEKITRKELTRITHPYFSTGWASAVGKMTPKFLDNNLDVWKRIHRLYAIRNVYHREIYMDIGVII